MAGSSIVCCPVLIVLWCCVCGDVVSPVFFVRVALVSGGACDVAFWVDWYGSKVSGGATAKWFGVDRLGVDRRSNSTWGGSCVSVPRFSASVSSTGIPVRFQ